jgi:hypothetical protein
VVELAQLYETTLIDRGSGLEARFIVAPARSFLDSELLRQPDRLAERLGMPSPMRPLAPSFLPAVLAATYAPPGTAEELMDRLRWPELDFRGLYLPRWYGPVAQGAADFLTYASYAEVIPFESSPLDAKSLASVVTSASGVGAGGYFGFLVAGGSPAAIITVPLGMIIGGAAAGVGRALEEGLYETVLDLIRERRERRHE